MTGRNRSIKT